MINKKEFFSIEKFNDAKALLIIEVILMIPLIILISTNKIVANFWCLPAFAISICIWLLSSIFDKKTYWNLATMISLCTYMYIIWWIIFNMKILNI